MPASFSNSQNSQAATPGPHMRALLERHNISDSFPMPPPFSQEEIDTLDKQQMHALLSSMASQPHQTAASPSENNLSATKPFELSPLPGYKTADHSSYNWLTATLTVYSKPLQDQSAQEGCTDSESDHAWVDCESEEVQSEYSSGSEEEDSEPKVDSESGGVNSESRELLDTCTAPSPSASDTSRAERPETVAPVGDMDQSQKLACRWVFDPDRALLCRHMGITADLDDKTQKQQSWGFRRDVCQKAEIDFSKIWTQLESEEKTEGMVCSILL